MVELFLEVVPITVLIGVLYAICRYLYVQKRGCAVSVKTEVFRFVFVCYLCGLVNLVLVPANLWSSVWFYLKNGWTGTEIAPLFSGGFNFVPTFVKCLRGETLVGDWVRDMLTGNFLMFIPMGVLLPLVFEKIRPIHTIAASVCVPLVIELLQPIVGRSFDVDDLIMNTIGILVGAIVGFGLRKIFCRRSEA